MLYRARASGDERALPTRLVIGADGTRSAVARGNVPGGDFIPYVIAYHGIIAGPSSLGFRAATPPRAAT